MSSRVSGWSSDNRAEGRQAQGEVDVKVDFDGVEAHGRGYSTDIVEASGKAYLNAAARAAARRAAQGRPKGD